MVIRSLHSEKQNVADIHYHLCRFHENNVMSDSEGNNLSESGGDGNSVMNVQVCMTKKKNYVIRS